MIRLPLKPISTNKIWSGKRWMSKEAVQFKRDAFLLIKAQRVKISLRKGETPALYLRFGLSRDMDVSNCIKLVEDIIAEALGINDIIFKGVVASKEKVKRGDEFIAFDIRTYDEGVFK